MTIHTIESMMEIEAWQSSAYEMEYNGAVRNVDGPTQNHIPPDKISQPRCSHTSPTNQSGLSSSLCTSPEIACNSTYSTLFARRSPLRNVLSSSPNTARRSVFCSFSLIF